MGMSSPAPRRTPSSFPEPPCASTRWHGSGRSHPSSNASEERSGCRSLAGVVCAARSISAGAPARRFSSTAMPRAPLGAFQFSWRRAFRIAVVFGLWDGISPLVGALIGRYLGHAIGPAADTLGPIVLAVYGLYLVVRSLKTQASEELDDRWVLFGMPLS